MKPWAPFQVMFWIMSSVPLEMRTMSKAPWPMIVRLERSMTPGRTETPEGGELSVPLTKTLVDVHSSQLTKGALMAACTSVRLK